MAAGMVAALGHIQQEHQRSATAFHCVIFRRRSSRRSFSLEPHRESHHWSQQANGALLPHGRETPPGRLLRTMVSESAERIDEA